MIGSGKRKKVIIISDREKIFVCLIVPYIKGID